MTFIDTWPPIPQSSWYNRTPEHAHVRVKETISDNKTFVVVVLNTGHTGLAKCHPDDRFEYNLGYELAKGRAYRNLAEEADKIASRSIRGAYDIIEYKEKLDRS